MSHRFESEMPVAEMLLAALPRLSSRASVGAAMRLMLDEGVDAVLSELDGAPAVITRADVDRVLPSPASSLAAYEVPGRVDRIRLAHALRGPSPTVPPATRVGEVVQRMREAGWRPVVVVDGETVLSTVSVEMIAEQIVGAPAA